jgi:hypothetical protein
MRHIILTAAAVLVTFVLAEAAFAGLGEPISGDSPEEALKTLKSSDVYRQALDLLKEKGYSQEQADAALEKLPPEHLSLLGSEVGGLKAGGDLIGLLLFVLFVALIIYLIIMLVESASYRRY